MNESEFAAIVGKTKRTVLSAVRRHLAARFFHAIDDVVQETYLRSYRHLAAGKFRNESSIESGLYAIARNESLRMNARLTREEEKEKRAAEEMRDRGLEAPHQEDDPARLERMVDGLPTKYREVLTLKMRGVPELEIAYRLGIRLGTVKSRFSRGKEILQRSPVEVS
ncbi:MAG: RNA polymerase sigma factor [Chrysiogenales bacterium]|nr:MAG: RNA polymerase sigma factor [Chrysiogenales bacterium]